MFYKTGSIPKPTNFFIFQKQTKKLSKKMASVLYPMPASLLAWKEYDKCQANWYLSALFWCKFGKQRQRNNKHKQQYWSFLIGLPAKFEIAYKTENTINNKTFQNYLSFLGNLNLDTCRSQKHRTNVSYHPYITSNKMFWRTACKFSHVM